MTEEENTNGTYSVWALGERVPCLFIKYTMFVEMNIRKTTHNEECHIHYVTVTGYKDVMG